MRKHFSRERNLGSIYKEVEFMVVQHNMQAANASRMLNITSGAQAKSTQCSAPCSRPPPTHAAARDSWTLSGKSGSVSCGVTAPFSWVHKVLFVPSRVCFLCKFYNQIPLPSKVKFPGGSLSLCQIPRLGNLLWVL